MKEECLICKALLEYLLEDRMMECAICGKQEMSKTRCIAGHYVCSDCHTQGMDSIFGLCMEETSRDPLIVLEKMMAMPFCHTHGPEHHVMVGAALLTACKNAGGEIDLPKTLHEMYHRGKAVPGGSCGFWGACGAGISAGQFLAIITESTPLSAEPWGLSNQMTAKALETIGKNGGPRCCKRDSYLAILAAIDFVAEHLHIQMEKSTPTCTRSHQNNQCLGKHCPFFWRKKMKKVAFVCVHNSCRSQIAEALGKKLAGDVFESYSAGTETKPRINQDAVRLMKEIHNIDMEKTQYSKLLSEIPQVDVVITMGCNVQCPYLPCSHREDWGLEDPSGKSDEAFIATITKIEAKILDLKERLKDG